MLERPRTRPTTPRELRRPPYALRHLHRYALGTPYPEILQDIVRLLHTPALRGCDLLIDTTGIGQAVYKMFLDGLLRRVTCTIVPIIITGGHYATANHLINVPKMKLVGVLQVLLQTRRLQIASGRADTTTLVRELETFRAHVAMAREGSFEWWREGQHDDSVFATAIAAWWGERTLPPLDDPVDARPSRVTVR